MCDALILFSELHRSKSPAPRLLLFPRLWLNEGADAESKELEITMRLLKKASRRFNAILVPIGPNLAQATHGADDPEAYSLAALFALTDFDRVLTLPPPGLILNSVSLDSILAFYDDEGHVAAYPPLDGEDKTHSSLLLVKPDTDVYKELISNLTTASDEMVLFADQSTSLLSARNVALPPPSTFTTAHTLRTAPPPFDAKAFSQNTAFVHLVDPELPGPEFDVPYQDIVKARPKDADQGFIWEKMYLRHKNLRYSVCGLDPVQWRPDLADKAVS